MEEEEEEEEEGGAPVALVGRRRTGERQSLAVVPRRRSRPHWLPSVDQSRHTTTTTTNRNRFLCRRAADYRQISTHPIVSVCVCVSQQQSTVNCFFLFLFVFFCGIFYVDVPFVWNTFWCLCVCVCVCVCVELDLKKKKERKEQQRRRTAPRTVEASRRPASTERPPWPPPTCSSKRFVSWFLERSAFVFWFVCFQPTDDCVTEFTEFFFCFVLFSYFWRLRWLVDGALVGVLFFFYLVIFGFCYRVLPSFALGLGSWFFFFEFL